MSSCQNAASPSVCEDHPPCAEAGPLRIILLGRTGTGRSSSGNTILGRSAFWEEVSPCSVTTRCKRQTGTVDGRSVSVIDTPGFLHTQMSPQDLMDEVGESVALSSPGPHVFLVTLRPARFTQEEGEALRWIKTRFGPEAAGFTVVLFTWGDQLRDKRIEDFVEESPELLEFVSGCQGGYHTFDNTKKCPEQVQQLLKKVDKLVSRNDGRCYSAEMLEEAEGALREAQVKILEEDDGRFYQVSGGKEKEITGSERSGNMDEEERKRAEKLFWCELVTALGRGAAEGAGILGKDKGKGKALKKVKVVERVAALAATPLSISSAAKAVGGAVREGSKVLFKHRKTLLH